MADRTQVINLEERAAALRESRGDSVLLDDISSVVQALVEGTVHDDNLDAIAVELKELLQFIDSAKHELLGIQAKSLSKRDIPDAGVELDAVVSATEEAASTIMDCADTISNLADSADDDMAVKLNDVATTLFQASSFQDLTGQRITKVTRTLTHLEERLNALADAIGDEYVAEDDDMEVDEEGVAKNDEDLLHGPQLEGEGNSQEEIDAILASFD